MKPKFRFWYEREDFYPDENYMRDVWEVEYIADNKIKLNDDYIFNPYTNIAENIYAKTKIYLMQYTGLKDKNDKEIYEGDIVKVGTLEGEPIGYIKWIPKSAEYRVINHIDPFGEEHVSFYHAKLFEVIGNIYENPGLLEVTK